LDGGVEPRIAIARHESPEHGRIYASTDGNGMEVLAQALELGGNRLRVVAVQGDDARASSVR
jgi:hypothetical protein